MSTEAPGLPSSASDASMHRRYSKACTVCRRDKIRCDGARPCNYCARQGIGSECMDSDFDTPPPASTSSVMAGSSSRRRASVSERAKLACQACRRDNKKCSDERPCPRCLSRGEECIHVERGPKVVKARCENCRTDNKKCEDARPCKYCVQQGKDCLDMPRRGKGHGTRVKAACTNCRHNKIRCDGNRPCAPCARKALQCIDRACRACTQAGKELECTHRRVQEPADSEADDTESPTLASTPTHSNSMFGGMPTHPEPYGAPSPPEAGGYPFMHRPSEIAHNTPSYYPYPTHTPEMHRPQPLTSQPPSYSYPLDRLDPSSAHVQQMPQYSSVRSNSLQPHLQGAPVQPDPSIHHAYANTLNLPGFYQTPTNTSFHGPQIDPSFPPGMQVPSAMYGHTTSQYYGLNPALASRLQPPQAPPSQPPHGQGFTNPSNDPYHP